MSGLYGNQDIAGRFNNGFAQETGKQMKHLGWTGLVMAIGVLATAVLVPNTTLAWLREESPLLSEGINQVEALWPAADTVHMLAFAVLGIMARLALPRTRVVWIILGALVFSIITELLQFYVPGRTPLVSDVRDNMLGLLAGLGFISLILWLYRHVTRRFG